MKSMMRRTTRREITASFGRYVAIMAIIALGVGLFSGLKVTKPTMVKITDDYVRKYQMYDYRLINLLGFAKEDVREFEKLDAVRSAEGAVFADVIYRLESEDADYVASVHSLTERINIPKVIAGRMPQKPNECVLDSKVYGKDILGEKLKITADNAEDTLGLLAYDEYEVVGLVSTPVYLNFERGNTSVGNGVVHCFVYIPEEGFSFAYYPEIYVKLDSDYKIHSDAYQQEADAHADAVKTVLEAAAQRRYEEVSRLLLAGLADSQGAADLQTGADGQLSAAQEQIAYFLTRNENIGYVCFESDASIVQGIANVFPIFFFLVAALVCITTMNRMVEEQRTQIGVLKALGYGKAAIMSKYMIYSGSAAMIGCIGGFLIGSYVFPNVIWKVYQLMYSVGGSAYLIDVPLACVSIVVSLLCSIGTTYLSCRIELGSNAAQLIRPKAPKSGKRIFLEYIPLIWNHMKFLHKVSARNILRYKKRFFMMVIGIAGCMALMLTGFGIRDSIADVVAEQYDDIQTYDMSIALKQALPDEQKQEVERVTSAMVEATVFYMSSASDISFGNMTKTVSLIVPESTENIGKVLHLFDRKNKAIPYPQTGEGVISEKLAKKMKIGIGDVVTVRGSDMREMKIKISDICVNYVYSYLYITPETYRQQLGTEPEYKSIWCVTGEGRDVHFLSAKLMNFPNVASVAVTEDVKERFATMMSSLNYIVVLVTFCAAALAFIVLYNLTNINITERIREIATIKVLGFYPGETAAYVFRENMVLTLIGAAAGIPLGIWLHRFVMSRIDIDIVNFHVQILPRTYLYGIVLTIVFAMLVNFRMYFKLKKINMAESLKSIE